MSDAVGFFSFPVPSYHAEGIALVTSFLYPATISLLLLLLYPISQSPLSQSDRGQEARQGVVGSVGQYVSH